VRILVDNTLLCDSALATGMVGPAGMSLNGESIEDVVPFFRAATKTYFDRAGENVVLQFRVERHFDTVRLAQKFFLTHRADVARQGAVTWEAGEGADIEDLYLSGAIVQLQMQRLDAVRVTVQYTIKGGAFTTDVPADLPASPDPADDFIVRRRGSIQLTAADVGKTVTFSTPLSAVPTTVWAWISRPSGGQDIRAIPNQPSYTVDGFDCDFTGAIPDTTYYLEYIAIE